MNRLPTRAPIRIHIRPMFSHSLLPRSILGLSHLQDRSDCSQLKPSVASPKVYNRFHSVVSNSSFRRSQNIFSLWLHRFLSLIHNYLFFAGSCKEELSEGINHHHDGIYHWKPSPDFGPFALPHLSNTTKADKLCLKNDILLFEAFWEQQSIWNRGFWHIGKISALQMMQASTAAEPEEKKKLWGGRFTGETDPLMEKFNESLYFDKRMWAEDIKASFQKNGPWRLYALNESSFLTDT